jgi:hypothetical protein
MKYRIAKKRMKRDTLLNLWLNHAKDNFDIIKCDQNTLSELSGLVVTISKKMLDYEFDQIKLIQKSMRLCNYQFFHYVADKVFK